MSLPRKKNKDRDAVVEDCVSSPDDNDDTSTSMEIYQTARNLEETEETRQLLSNSSDADVSSSDSVQTALDLSCKATESQKEDIPRGTGSKLQKSPKKVLKRTKMDSKVQGEREDDSSDEMESKCFKKSAKRIKCDIEEYITGSVSESSTETSQIPKSTLKRERVDSEKLVDSKDDSRNETDTKSLQLKSDIVDNQSLFSKNLLSPTFQIDTAENFSGRLTTRSASEMSPDKLNKTISETTEISTAVSEDAVDLSVEAGFTHVKSSDLIAAAVASAIHKPERSPQSRTSIDDDEEKIKHDNELKNKFQEKEQSDADKPKSLEVQVKASEIISAAMSSIFENLERIKYKDTSSKATECCKVQSVAIEKIEDSSESNLSIERMEYSSESNIDRSIRTNTDVEQMEYSSESCIGFENVKSGNDSNMSFEKMDCKSESSLSREEMETETISVKSTDVEGMEYSSESVLAESESILSQDRENITCDESESNSYEVKNIVLSNIDESFEIQRDPIPVPSILVESEFNSNEVKNIVLSNIDESLEIQTDPIAVPRILVESEFNSNEVKNIVLSNIDESLAIQRDPIPVPSILVESESNKNEVENINESNVDESRRMQRKLSIPLVVVESASNSNEGENIIPLNVDESTETPQKVPPPVKSEFIIDNDSGSNSDEVKNIYESNIDEILGIERKFSIPRIESVTGIESSDTDEYEYDQNRGEIKENEDSKASKKTAPGDQERVLDVEESSNLDGEPSFKRKKSVGDQEIRSDSAPNAGGSTDTQKDTADYRKEFSDTDSDEFGETKDIDNKKKPKQI